MTTTAPIDAPPCQSLTAPLVDLLAELADVISRLDDRQYAAKPVGVIPSSVGGHVRHCLDHVRALVGAAETGWLDYDRRERGTDVETSRGAALAAIDRLVADLRDLPEDAPEISVAVQAMMTAGGPPVLVASSLGREMAFVLSHTIHHNALVGAMVRMLGGDLPPRFGYAPATLAFAGRSARA